MKLHVDGTKHDMMDLQRRVNVILYLNKGWKSEWGGNLEFNDHSSDSSKVVLPEYNRMVVFTTNDYTIHGHPKPVQTPDGRSRLSIIQYYYTSSRPQSDLKNGHHRAIFG